MAFPVNGPGGITPKERPAIPTHPPPKRPEIKVKGDARAVAQEPPAGERVQPPDLRRLRQLNRIVQNSPMSPNPRVSRSTGSSAPALTPPGPSGSVSSQGVIRMSDGELVRSVDHTLHAGRRHPGLRVPDQLFTQLASHPFIFEKMPTRDLVKLFVALNEFGDSRLDGLREGVDAALNKRLGEMELSPPIASMGATSAAVRAALVDRLSSLKEDVETLSLLAKESSNLPRDRKTELAAAIANAIPKMIVKLAEVMLQGTEERSTRIISKAVDLARLAHTTLLKSNPQAPADLQAFITEALRRPELEPQVNGAETVCAGSYLNEKGRTIKLGNEVCDAARRPLDGIDTPENRVALDVQIFRRAVAYAYKPEWSEPTGEGSATTDSLFGDGRAWPTPGVGSLKAELLNEKKYFDRVDSTKRIDGLLTLLEGFHTIKNAGQMTQKEAERQMARLQALANKHEFGEPLGSETFGYRWDLARLKGLSPKARVEELRKMLEPARIQAQRQIATDVTMQRARVRSTKKEDADTKERQRQQREKGAKVDVSAFVARGLEDRRQKALMDKYTKPDQPELPLTPEPASE